MLTGFSVWSASFHSNGWPCSENQSFCRGEGYKPGQTVWQKFQSLSTASCCYLPTRHLIVALTEANPVVPQTFIQIQLSFLCFADVYLVIMLLFFKGASLQRGKPRSELFPCAVRPYPPSHLTVLSPCRWNILMDYCYTTPSGNPNDELRYDLFFR